MLITRHGRPQVGGEAVPELRHVVHGVVELLLGDAEGVQVFRRGFRGADPGFAHAPPLRVPARMLACRTGDKQTRAGGGSGRPGGRHSQAPSAGQGAIR